MDDFPNRMPRRRQSTTSTRPGAAAMTEPPEPAVNKPQGNDTSVDPDTCRICRGEGTTDEPLFYPCKCSGSIKYVHQDCLMEWLSHSQKKHCELCKTPFRFTKLYSPDMPKRLPLHIFLGHMAKYMFRNVLVWLRAALVASVWLGWLPYLMRSIWSFLFWISDDGFGPSPSGLYSRNAAAIRRDSMVSLSFTGTTTCASSPLVAATTTAASIGGIVDHIPVSSLLKAISRPLNVTATQSWLSKLLGVSTTPEKSARAVMDYLNLTHVDEVALLPVPSQHSSLLGDIKVLKNMTRHPAINRTIIAVLEGQVITLLVIVCFILIILVRDYVVQQQPEINMRAAFAAAENEAHAPDEPVHPIPRGPVAEEDEDSDADDDSVVARDGSLASANSGQDDAALVEREQSAIGPRNLPRRPAAGLRRQSTRQDIELTPQGEIRQRENSSHAGPSIPTFQTLGQVKGLQPQPSSHNFVDELLENTHGDVDHLRADVEEAGEDLTQFTAKEYIRIYKQAGGNRERILQIIRDEDLEDRLQYWVSRTHAKTIAGRPASRDGLANDMGSLSSSSELRPTHSLISDSPKPGQTGGDASSWTWSKHEDGVNNVGYDSQSKGKGKDKAEDNLAAEATNKETTPWLSWGNDFGNTARHHLNDEDDAQAFFPSTRPRAISDGPQPNNTINMLANNNWSFSDLPRNLSEVPGEVTHEIPSSDLAPPVSRLSLSSSNTFEGLHKEVPTTNMPNHDVFVTNDIEHPNYLDSPVHNDVIQTMEQQIDFGDGIHTPTSSNDLNNSDGMVERVHDAQRAGVAPQHQVGIVGRMADFMWGNVEAGPADDVEPEEAVDPFGDHQNAPLFDPDHEDEGQDENDVEIAPDVVEAAVAAGIDPEAIEDAEDFEGIMELIGMRGPVAGLFQNAIFCAFLVSTSIFVGIFIPYNIGRVTVWILANPTRLIRMVVSFSKFVQDAALLAAGYSSNFVFKLIESFRLILRIEQGEQIMHALRSDATHVAAGALDRIAGSLMSEMPLISVSEVRNFSAVSHEALVFVKNDIYRIFSTIGGLVFLVFGGDYASKWSAARAFVATAGPELLKAIPSIVTHPGSWMINLDLPKSSSVNPGLAYWDADDRTWAILIGYLSFSVFAGLYLGRGTPFFTGPTAQEWEASIIDVLNQASGVMKVILIISIEMLIFPLYCGLLLDLALLPLFESTSFRSRLLFTYNYPLTSIFVHWFVGTGYMFHFALFVSMCRKIMRKGVLYFIRDPDDPEFHPVRDVLERNVTTQLRKILFSAFVYGALVVVCLGGVVWGLSLALPSVLPIHYSSNEPVLEFPIDLLFYNFLMPLAVKFFKPSDGLHAMYTWWFRKCARALRLTWFLFGERRVDEEGKLTLTDDSPYHNLPLWRRSFLEVNSENEVVPKTWRNIFAGGKAKPNPQIPVEEMIIHNSNKTRLVGSRQLVPNGRFVRSPASDQVKIPKGQPVFLDVSEEEDVRRDGKPDQTEADLYSGNNYQLVYVPPWFRVRIFLFILFIWIFAAVTGVGITIVPLVFGRRMFKVLIPSHIRTNDIYAFSIGIYILGSVGYFIFHLRSTIGKLRAWATSSIDSMFDHHVVQRGLQLVKSVLRLLYTYVVLLVVFPLLSTLLVELYLLMPLHTYMYPAGIESSKRLDGLRDGHTIRVIQAWTLGILYLKLGSRALTLYGGRPAQAVRAVLRRGWLEPDVGVLTRAFVIPGVTTSLAMILLPPLMAWAILRRGSDDGGAAVSHEMRVLIFRLAYPLTALFWTVLLLTRSVLSVFEGWQVRIRDEAYLMGERLHNFGGTATAARVDAWRGSTRL